MLYGESSYTSVLKVKPKRVEYVGGSIIYVNLKLITMYNSEIEDWMNDGNVVKVGKDTYIEQTTQWKKKFTKKELIKFYIKEFVD
tara:strand:- start:67 stop:321 length:255 start_codon:yes stop_codon:yes gene_type:complete